MGSALKSASGHDVNVVVSVCLFGVDVVGVVCSFTVNVVGCVWSFDAVNVVGCVWSFAMDVVGSVWMFAVDESTLYTCISVSGGEDCISASIVILRLADLMITVINMASFRDIGYLCLENFHVIFLIFKGALLSKMKFINILPK